MAHRVIALILVLSFVVVSIPTNVIHSHIALAASTPTITAYDISPRMVAPGGTITFSYTINNPSSSSQNVGLGASIMLGGTSLNDPANDIVVSVAPGTSTKTRSFKIPSTATLGTYNVYWRMWSGTPGSSTLYQEICLGGYLVVKAKPINWLLIGGILAGVALVGIAVGWRLKSKKRKPAGTS